MSSAVSSSLRPSLFQPGHELDPTINILLATFPGLGLPRTLSLQAKASQSISRIYALVFSRLPDVDGLLLTTVSNTQLLSSDEASVGSLLGSQDDRILSLRLSRKLCGGKGGFGSQLRAAGGRMSSRKNRDRQENINGSNRNLDGRRLRTIDEAKRLAEYLAIKPEMDQREKDARKKRWEAVVEAAERKEEDIKSGKSGANQGRLDAQYVESKEAAEEKTREAVLRAMKEDFMELERTGSESSGEMEEDTDEDEDQSSGSVESANRIRNGEQNGLSFFGWDDQDEDENEDEDSDEEEKPKETGSQAMDDAVTLSYEGKGKAKAS